MSRSSHAISLLLSLALLAPPAAGAAGSYFALDFMFSEYKENDSGIDTLRPAALSVRYGRHLTPGLALEGRIGTGIADDSDSDLATTVDLSIDSVIGAYLRASIAPERDVALYALAGIARADLDAGDASSASGFNAGTETDLSLGFGLEAEISREVSFSFEFIQLAYKRDFDLSTLTLGLKVDL